jgi:transcriptional regulator with XRE-family HTH domain
MNFHIKLVKARQALGLSQAQFAARAGITAQTQLKYEKAKNFPTIEYLRQIKKLGVDVSDLLELKAESDPKKISISEAIEAFKEADAEGRSEKGELLDVGLRLRLFKEYLSTKAPRHQ